MRSRSSRLSIPQKKTGSPRKDRVPIGQQKVKCGTYDRNCHVDFLVRGFRAKKVSQEYLGRSLRGQAYGRIWPI